MPELEDELLLLKVNELLFKHCAATGSITGFNITPELIVTVSLYVQLLSSVAVTT